MAAGAHIEIDALTIVEGTAQLGNSGVTYGGSLFNEGTVILDSVRVMHNTANFGGGIFNATNGYLSATNSTFDHNVALQAGLSGASGGAYYGYPGSGATLTNSTVSTNYASGGPGATSGAWWSWSVAI